MKKCLQIVGLWKNSWKCDSRPIRPTGKTNLETIFNSTREINRFNMLYTLFRKTHQKSILKHVFVVVKIAKNNILLFFTETVTLSL